MHSADTRVMGKDWTLASDVIFIFAFLGNGFHLFSAQSAHVDRIDFFDCSVCTSLGGYRLCIFQRSIAARPRNFRITGQRIHIAPRDCEINSITIRPDRFAERLIQVASNSRTNSPVALVRAVRAWQGWWKTYLVYVLKLPCCGCKLGRAQQLVTNRHIVTKLPVALCRHGPVQIRDLRVQWLSRTSC